MFFDPIIINGQAATVAYIYRTLINNQAAKLQLQIIKQQLDDKDLGFFCYNSVELGKLDQLTLDLLLKQSVFQYHLENYAIVLINFTPSVIKLLEINQGIENFFFCKLDFTATLNNPGLLISDMDMTLVQLEVIDKLAALQGVEAQVSEITEQAMQGQLDFAQSLIARVALLKGLAVSELDQVAQQLPLTPGLANSIKILQAFAWKIGVVSGGFTPIVKHLAEQFNFNYCLANDLGVSQVDGVAQLDGTVQGKIIDAPAKALFAEDCLAKSQFTSQQLVTLGDGANDIKMSLLADLAVGVVAKPALAAVVKLNIPFPNLEPLVVTLLTNAIVKQAFTAALEQ